jgi:hypothetical protein
VISEAVRLRALGSGLKARIGSGRASGQALVAFSLLIVLVLGAQDRGVARRVTWEELAPVHARLDGAGVSASTLPAFLERVHTTNVQRVREGDLDHLIFYLLQSTRFPGPPIEPALSAKELVSSSRVPDSVHTRVSALLSAIEKPGGDARLAYFRDLVHATFPDAQQRQDGVLREYARAMRFLYEKEFVAQRSTRPADAIAELYRSRGLSTDTAVEAGYLVYQGLGIVRALASAESVRRVLIIGPGLDLAPRTGLIESGPPESYQPWAVIDALVSLGVARLDTLDVVAADINPRVVTHLRHSTETPPVLTMVSGIANTSTVTLTQEYRDYFSTLGRAVGGAGDASTTTAQGHLKKTVRVRAEVARRLQAETVDIVTERLAGERFDLIIATNILPYFDDTQLTLALSNIAAMVAPGGVFLHNEARPLLAEVTAALGLPVEQSRHAVIATVRGAPAPLFDSVWLHRKKETEDRR